jgi:hypothetical protein
LAGAAATLVAKAAGPDFLAAECSVARYNVGNQSAKEDDGDVDLMNLEEQVDREFTTARRRARLRGLRVRLRGKPGRGTLLSFEKRRRSMRASGGFRRGRATVELSRIVGSAGKHDCFDEGFMPLRAVSCVRWKRADKAFRLGLELPPAILYSLDGLYFVKDGHHTVSVALFHGAEWMDAEVTEFRSPGDQARARACEPHADPAISSAG